MDDGYTSGRAAMPHIMALNKDPTMGMKNNRQPAPAVSNVTAFAKGGAVKPSAKKGAPEMARHNKLMHKGQPSKLNKGGKACAKGGKVGKYAAGGAAKVRKASPKPKPIKKVSLRGG